MVISSRFEIICILFVYAGQVPLSRVHFDPKQESDCLENFKIICSTFRKLDIDKVFDNMFWRFMYSMFIIQRVDVDRLVKLKFQDNLLFLHWFKKFFDKEAKKQGRISGVGKCLSNSKLKFCCYYSALQFYSSTVLQFYSSMLS